MPRGKKGTFQIGEYFAPDGVWLATEISEDGEEGIGGGMGGMMEGFGALLGVWEHGV